MDLFGCVLLGCLGYVEQSRASIPMRYFGLFGLFLTNLWIYSNAPFWVVSVVWVLPNKFVDLFGWVILGSLGFVGQIRSSIRMRYFGLFRLS